MDTLALVPTSTYHYIHNFGRAKNIITMIIKINEISEMKKEKKIEITPYMLINMELLHLAITAQIFTLYSIHKYLQ